MTTAALHPGTDCAKTLRIGGVEGRKICTFVVVAVSSSFGTRNAICVSLAPFGALSGATVTCAQAGMAPAHTSPTINADAATISPYHFRSPSRLQRTRAIATP